MPSIFGLAGPQFGLVDCQIAKNNLNGTFGTEEDVPSVQLLDVKYNTTTANLEGDDTITAVQARAISAEVTLRFGSIKQEVLEIITGETLDESGATPNRRNRLKFDGAPGFPWFALCGRADAAEDAISATLVFIPKLKCTSGFAVRMEYGAFSIPEITAIAVKDPDYGCFFEVTEYETAPVVTIPPQA